MALGRWDLSRISCRSQTAQSGRFPTVHLDHKLVFCNEKSENVKKCSWIISLNLEDALREVFNNFEKILVNE